MNHSEIAWKPKLKLTWPHRRLCRAIRHEASFQREGNADDSVAPNSPLRSWRTPRNEALADGEAAAKGRSMADDWSGRAALGAADRAESESDSGTCCRHRSFRMATSQETRHRPHRRRRRRVPSRTEAAGLLECGGHSCNSRALLRLRQSIRAARATAPWNQWERRERERS